MSEGARVGRMLDSIRLCAQANAIQRAQALYGAGCGGAGTCGRAAPDLNQETPLESDLLNKRLANCYTVQRPQPSTEQQRIQSVILCVADKSVEATNPEARFLQFAQRVVPPVCPPTAPEILNAFLPKATTRCPLPNKPYLSYGI